MRRVLLLLIALMVLGCRPSETLAESHSAESPFTLTNVRLLTGELVNVVVEGERLVSIGEPTAGRLLDCTGLTVLPGFIDCHVHLGFFEPAAVLQGGVTTVRDLGWTPQTSLQWVEEAKQNPTWGPQVLAVGPMLTAQGGYPLQAGWAPPGTGAVFTPQLLRELQAAGVCSIKVTLEPGAGPTLSLKELKELVLLSHQLGLKVGAHVSSEPELAKALAAGVDELSHFVFDNTEVSDEMLQDMLNQDVTVVPTLRVNPSSVRLSNLRRFYQAGGRIVYGTDLGNGGPPGIDIQELELMKKAGLAPEDIVDSATRGAAEHLGLEARGEVKAGFYADLLLVEGDPLEDFSILARPRQVMREGQIVRRNKR